MWNFFNPDGLFARIMNTVWNLILLNVLWLLCCVPVVTVGAATAALYAVLLKMRDGGENRVVRLYFAALKENFRRATAVWLVLLAALAVCGLDLALATQAQSMAARVICMAGLLFVAMVWTFAFLLVARYENTWRGQLKNAALLALSHLPRLLLAWLPWAACILLTIWSAQTLYVILPLWLMAGFSSLHYYNLMVFTPVLRKLEPAAEDPEA